MDKRLIRLLQRVLASNGYYDGRIDGLWGDFTEAGILAMNAARSDDLQGDAAQWSMRRRAIACLQLGCRDAGRAVGAIDGLWGPQTDNAVEEFETILDTGAEPVAWRDDVPVATNPHSWPNQSEAALTAFFGDRCDESQLVSVQCPWQLSLDWNLEQRTRTIRCHKRVADSLGEILARLYDHYGEAELRRLGLHRYGGSYNCRAMRGGTQASTHSWGIAIDWYPSRNKLRWGRDQASLASPDCDAWWRIWEAEGWVSLGRSRNFDWMHVQAAKID
jgi:hypothetical protein